MTQVATKQSLLDLKQELADKKAKEMRESLANGIGKRFASVKNGVKKTAYLIEVKKREVKLKRELEAKDSYSEPIESFSRYYRLDE